MPTKVLTAAVAQPLFLKDHPLIPEVTAKFFDDHMITTNLSKSQAIASAVERYKKNRNTKSSWIEISKETLINKAKGSTRRVAGTFGAPAKQQLTVQIKVDRKTITISVLDKKEKHQYEHEIVEIDGEDHYLNCSSAATANVDLRIVGDWDPLTGKLGLYHYEEGAIQQNAAAAMLQKYLLWNTAMDGSPTTPVATA